MLRLFVGAALILAVLLAGGCSTQKTKEQQPEAGQQLETNAQARTEGEPLTGDVVVQLVNMRFVPQEIKAKIGDRVVFVNNDGMEHDIVHDAGQGIPLFASPTLSPGQSWTYVADRRGVFPIKCVYAGHYALGMVGTLTVE